MKRSGFLIEEIEILANGSLPEVAAKTGEIYWINGTDQTLLFVLSPTTENLKRISTLTDAAGEWLVISGELLES